MPMAVVTGTVWNDVNADGIWQKEEPGIPGIRLTMTGGKDKINYEVYTDENGFYDFHQIKKGTSKVICQVPDEYVFTVKAKGELEVISRMTTDTYNLHRMIGMMQRIGIRAPILLLGGISLRRPHI